MHTLNVERYLGFHASGFRPRKEKLNSWMKLKS